MGNIKYIHILILAIFISGCSKNKSYVPNDSADSNAISFGTEAMWTKGSDISDIKDIDELEVYSYWIDNNTSWNDAAAADLKPYFTTDVNTPFKLALDDAGIGSYEGGEMYWPAINGVQLSFYTYYPASDNFVRTIDATSGKPTYKYTSSESVQKNSDLVYSAKCDLTVAKNNNSGEVDFNLKHLLSKLSLRAKTSNVCSDDATYVEGSVSYTITDITISGLYPEADIVVGVDENLNINDEAKTVAMTASEGFSLKDIESDESAELYQNLYAEGDGYTNIMNDGEAIFVVPQKIVKTIRRDNAPTVKLHIRKEFEIEGAERPSTVIYETGDIVIPAADASNSWEAGKHYGLLFDFDLSKLDKYDTPLTVRSEIYDWVRAEIDVDIYKNIYTYASENYIDVSADQDHAEMFILTNYGFDLRFFYRKYELDGTPSEADGFSFYITDNQYNEITGMTLPTLLWKNNGNFPTKKDWDYTTLREFPFNYDADGNLQAGGVKVDLDENGYADPTKFCDSEGYMYFIVKPDPSDPSKNFYYKALKTTRGELDLYTYEPVGDDNYYGVEKHKDDPVYKLQLDINTEHLVDKDSKYGYFYGKVCTEMISNNGGILTNKFKATIKKEL